MTCAKKTVRCDIIIGDKVYAGFNFCDNPQRLCPRGNGEGYEKCKTVCKQPYHAEEAAIESAKAENAYPDAESFAIVSGIDNICKNCQRKLIAFGITKFEVRP